MAGGQPDEWLQYFNKYKQDYEAIYIDKWNQKWYYQNGPDRMPIEHSFWAIGSGGKIAMAGMHMGLSAVDAVLLAGDLDVYTNKIVDTYDIQTGKIRRGKPHKAVVTAPETGTAS